MKQENSTFAQIAYDNFIDIELNKEAKNVLIIGNTLGFFGYYREGNRTIELDEGKTGNMEAMSNRLIWMMEALQSGVTFTVLGNKETLDYYSMVFEFFKEAVKFNWKKQLKAKQIEKDNEYLDIMNKAIEKNMKFDFVIQNPPYSGSLHLNFLEKGLELLDKEKGKMTIIEPATWLINLRKNGKAKKYDEIKKLLKGHVSKVIIENMNKEFNTCLSVPFAITYIDYRQKYDMITFNCFGEELKENSLYDCNLIGDYNLIWSIFNKVKTYGNMMENHIYKEDKTKTDENTYFAVVANIMRGGLGDPRFSDEWFINGLYRCYYYHCFNNKEPISKSPHHLLKTGYTYLSPQYKDELALNIYGTKEELENFKYFIFNNKLSVFINICIIQDMTGSSIDTFIPWLVDKQYTDEEINKLFNFSTEEIALIDKTIKKFERNSPWFKRYMCGKDSVSDEEVQKFIDNL